MNGKQPPLPSPFQRFPSRVQIPEILDEHGSVTTAQLQKSLDAMAAVNRRLGGVRSLLKHLSPLVTSSSVSTPGLTLLDVGAGAGQVPGLLQAAFKREGHRLRWVGVDWSREPLSLWAPSEAGAMVQADARRLPFPDNAFDVVISTLVLHHFSDEEVRHLLAEGARVARRRVIMSDLERHPLHYMGARFLALTWWRKDPVTRFDGPASVLRSFTRRELLEITEGLPYQRVKVHRHLPFRIVLDGEPA